MLFKVLIPWNLILKIMQKKANCVKLALRLFTGGRRDDLRRRTGFELVHRKLYTPSEGIKKICNKKESFASQK
uniref:Ribosomal protein S16 n=1 Tax=Panagrolaimus sp. JU765 TaxID=591449 RepID=A0AC34RJA8_9BILA